MIFHIQYHVKNLTLFIGREILQVDQFWENPMSALVAVTIGCFAGPALGWIFLKLPDFGEWLADKFYGPKPK